MRTDDQYNFARESYDAIDKSWHPVLRSCSPAWRNKIASWVLVEWETLRPSHSEKAQFEAALRARVRARVKQRVGFVWLPLALFIAEIIIKILLERWFNK
jgi:hypothetical protein